MGLIYKYDFRHEFAHDRQRQHADVLHSDAFSERRAAERTVFAVERVPERRIERSLRPDDLDRRHPGSSGDRIPRNESATADGNHQHIEVGRIFQHLECDCALSGDHKRIVIGVHEGQAALAG